MERKTKICCFDVDQEIIDWLTPEFDVFNGSLGTKVRVSKWDDSYVKLLANYVMPDNLHEYDIFIIDFKIRESIPYRTTDHQRKSIEGKESAWYFRLEYPQNLFNPIPIGAYVLNKRLKTKTDKTPLVIIFQVSKESFEYHSTNEVDYSCNDALSLNNYEFVKNFCEENSCCGTQVHITDRKLANTIFSKFADAKMSYEQTFLHPTVWNEDLKKSELSADFLPLLVNNNEEIVSYLYYDKEEFTMVLPQVSQKQALLKHIFNVLLYPHFSNYFPTIAEKQWINNASYLLPNIANLLHEKEELKQDYDKKIESIDKQIRNNEQQYQFLHELLTETGDKLVQAVVQFLKWLGFKNVYSQDMRQIGNVLEEDVQVDLGEDGLLIIEVKGIGGTSTDAECSQIDKIKYRRCEERGKFDVHALYFVNNERHIEPLKRTLPPFNELQIKDAQNCKRGLVYTWQLFNLYFNIENGLLTKEEARNHLLEQIGLVDFTPVGLLELGIPYHYYDKNTVICLEIKDISLRIGDTLVFEKDGRYEMMQIKSLQIDHINYNEITNGRVGIKVDKEVPHHATIYLKKN